MAESDHSLDILIKTAADLAGAKSAQAALEKQIIQSKILGKEYSAQQAQLQKVKSAIAEYGGETEKAGGESKLFAGHAGEVRKSIRELHEQFPVLANAIRLVTNPVGGTLAIGIGVFTKAKEAIDEWNKSLDESAEKLREPTFAEAIKARKEVLEAGEIAAATYADKLAHLIDPEETYKKLVESEIGLIKARNEAQNQIATAAFGADEAQIKHTQSLQEAALTEQLAEGLINYQQYVQAKTALEAEAIVKINELEIQHETQKLLRDQKSRWDEIAAQERLLEHQKDAQAGLDKSAAQTRERATKAAAAVARDSANLARDESGDAAKAVQDARSQVAGFAPSGATADEAEAAAREAAAAGVARAKIAIDALDTALAQARAEADERIKIQRRLPGEKVEAALSGSAAERAAARAEANAGRINEGAFGLQQAKDAANLADDAARRTAQETDRAGAVKAREELDKINVGGGFTGASIETAAGLEDARAHHRQLSAADNAQLDAFKAYAQSRGLTDQQIHNLLMTIVNSHATFVDQLLAMKKLVEDLTRRIQSVKNP